MSEFDEDIKVIVNETIKNILPDIKNISDKINLISIEIKLILSDEFIFKYNLNNDVAIIAQYFGNGDVIIKSYYKDELIDQPGDMLNNLQQKIQ